MRVNSKEVTQIDKKTGKPVKKFISDQYCRLCRYSIIDDIVTKRHGTIRGLKGFTACSHVYHSDCIKGGNSCPECSKWVFKSKLSATEPLDDQGTYDEDILDPEQLKK